MTPPLQRHAAAGGRSARWNRCPPGSRVNLERWRQQLATSEAVGGPRERLRMQVAAVNQQLAPWLRQHRYVVPAGSDDPLQWESGVALLLLWEVGHAQEFVTEGSAELSQRLVSFSRRLQARVSQDAELREWLR